MATEREKMRSGQFYHEDADMASDMQQARRLSDHFNALPGDSPDTQNLLQQLLGGIGERVTIRSPFRCDYGKHTFIGDDTFLNFDCVVLDEGQVNIGSRVWVGPGVHIYAVTHPEDPDDRATRALKALPVTIEDDVWIGGGAKILPGVTVGRGSIIGAGSVVTKDVAPMTIVGGNPAKFIRQVKRTEKAMANAQPDVLVE